MNCRVLMSLIDIRRIEGVASDIARCNALHNYTRCMVQLTVFADMQFSFLCVCFIVVVVVFFFVVFVFLFVCLFFFVFFYIPHFLQIILVTISKLPNFFLMTL